MAYNGQPTNGWPFSPRMLITSIMAILIAQVVVTLTTTWISEKVLTRANELDIDKIEQRLDYIQMEMQDEHRRLRKRMRRLEEDTYIPKFDDRGKPAEDYSSLDDNQSVLDLMEHREPGRVILW